MVWHFLRKRKFQYAVVFILILGFGLRMFVATDPFLHEWDERYHALVAKNTINGPLKPTLYINPILDYDYKNWVGNHVWVHKQPMTLWILATSMKIFGVNLFGLRFLTVLISLLAVWLTYLIGSKLYDKKVGIIAAYLHGINGLIIEQTGGRVATDHVDVLFLFFIEMAMWFIITYQGKRAWWNLMLIGASTGFAVLTKWLPALIIFPVFFAFDYKGWFDKKTMLHAFIIGLTILAVSAPWQIFTAIQYPLENAWEKHFNWLHITSVLDNQGGPFYYFFSKLRIHYGEIMYLPFIWLVIRKKNWFDRKKLALLAWMMIPLLFFSIPKTKMQGYTLFIAPAVFIVLALFVRNLSFSIPRLEKSSYQWIAKLIIGLLLFLPVRYCIERTKPFSTENRTPPIYMNRVLELQKNNTESLVIEGCSHPIETMFFTNHTAYEQQLSNAERLKVEKLGYKIVQF